ncbi:hypothetical protein PF010_g21186 [Phytophthora fragariae]|uniref:Uncharacterized protein n=1 Tax=Phytophthora fragariae TaxID=53985 RepID=A0A6A3R346_9STRA|nr:hypothetical protein PF010_g21186 [Phytophthora fragariae]KAE9088929.1 hypothetical protein PF007_g19789 [Phytophthora fragariae]KAE9307075.1 hypothetical protein PF008_g21324 [Phytophthora fragariae]
MRELVLECMLYALGLHILHISALDLIGECNSIHTYRCIILQHSFFTTEEIDAVRDAHITTMSQVEIAVVKPASWGRLPRQALLPQLSAHRLDHEFPSRDLRARKFSNEAGIEKAARAELLSPLVGRECPKNL